MAKIADADKMRAGKLDSAWVKAVWVGRVDRSNEHLLLTTKGCIRSRVVRHSSTKSEIISLDIGLRLDGLLPLELRDLIVSVFGNTIQTSDRMDQPVVN